MKPTTDKIYPFAKRMSELLFDMRREDIADSIDLPEEFIDMKLNNPEHIKNIKLWIERAVIAHLGERPDDYVNDAGDDYEYKPDTYDHAHLMDSYLQLKHNEIVQARLIKKYKVWVHIETIEEDPETEDVNYFDDHTPFGIALCKTKEDAEQLREDINKTYGKINPPLP